MGLGKLNTGDFGSLALEGEKFYFRCRSFVDIKSGQPLAERRQQKLVIATRDSSLYKSIEKSSALHVKADELRAKITTWETAAQEGATVNSDGEVVLPSLPAIAPDGEMTIAEFFKTIFIPAKRALVETGQLAAISFKTYQAYWNMFLGEHYNGTKTFANYKSWMGRQYLETLRKADGTPYGENTVKKIHSVSSAIFTEAVERGYLDHNPWSDIKRAKMPKVSAEQGVAYTEAEVETMIANLDKDRGQDKRRDESIQTAQVALAIGFWAGLRPSEIIALNWKNVDVNQGTIKVCESNVNRVHAKRTKTDEDRIVTYLEPLIPILRRWHERNGRPTEGFVLKGQGNSVVNLVHLSERIIYPNCERNGLGERWKGTAFYGLRRGCGTLLVQTGSSIEQGSKFLGNTAAVFEANYWVDKGQMAAQAAENYRRTKLEGKEQQERKQVAGELAALGLGSGG